MNRIVLFSVGSQAFKIVAGPISLLFISKYLNSEELGFYYTFLSLIAMQQLLELGVSYVIKQYISSSVTYSKKGKLLIDSVHSVASYIKFSKAWFSFLSAAALIVFLIVGYGYFSSNDSQVNWFTPWVLTCLAASFSIFIIPYKI